MIAETAADLCRYLNELTALDPRAMYRQVRTLSPCNDAVWYRLTERRVVTSDVGAMLGMLGLLNGWLAESGLALIVNLDHDADIVTGFEVERIAPAPAVEPAVEPADQAMFLVCPHCGLESAGPAADKFMACTTCYGDLVLAATLAEAEALCRSYGKPEADPDGA